MARGKRFNQEPENVATNVDAARKNARATSADTQFVGQFQRGSAAKTDHRVTTWTYERL